MYETIIIGGGVAGLWTLATLRARGVNALLLAPQALGSGQTIASQGIIHAGLKYALTGEWTATAQRIADTAARWQAALRGEDPVLDLRSVTPLATMQHILVPDTLLGKLGSLVVSKAVRGVQQLAKDAQPAALRDLGFKGQVVEMAEPVLPIDQVLAAFQAQYGDYIQNISPDLQLQRAGDGWQIYTADKTLITEQVVVAAGSLNQVLADQLNLTLPEQRRPLHMPMLRGALPYIYMHLASDSFRPLATITSHPAGNETVWYIGGQVAESGVDQNPADLFFATQRVLARYFPRLDFSALSWDSLRITRAEGKDERGWLPDEPTLSVHDKLIFAWPNKLTFAPLLAERVLQHCHPQRISVGDLNNTQAFGSPDDNLTIAHYPWQS